MVSSLKGREVTKECVQSSRVLGGEGLLTIDSRSRGSGQKTDSTMLKSEMLEVVQLHVKIRSRKGPQELLFV